MASVHRARSFGAQKHTEAKLDQPASVYFLEPQTLASAQLRGFGANFGFGVDFSYVTNKGIG